MRYQCPAVRDLGDVRPILINTFTGVRVIDRELVEAARAFGARRRDVFAKVLMPGAVPFIVAGLRLGVSRGIIGVVVGELLGSTAGIGYMLYTATRSKRRCPSPIASGCSARGPGG